MTEYKTVIEYLVKNGAKVNEKNKYGMTPLHYAAARGNEEALIELLKCPDIDISVRTHGKPIIMYKSCYRSLAFFHQSRDEQKLTPLHMAVSYGQISSTRILLENGAKVENMGEKKQTSLHKACTVGEIKIVQMLIDCVVQITGDHEVTRLLQLEDIDCNT